MFPYWDYALLQGTIKEDKMKVLIELGSDLKSRGINIARTLDYRITNGQKGSEEFDIETMCYEIAAVLRRSGKYFKFASNENIKESFDKNIAKIFGK